jgi:NAD(P)-dependent dehydrogenase (short-subunit alcohol dehydrogenase family)
VYLTARSSERGQAAAATAGAQFLELDVTSGKSAHHAAGCLERAGGHLDVLVNNAGITGPVRDDPRDYTTGDMTEVLLTNVVGYIRVIHAFLPLLEKSDDPRIVNVSSGLGSRPAMSSSRWGDVVPGQPGRPTLRCVCTDGDS